MWSALTSVPDGNDVINTFSIVSMLVFGLVFLLSAVYSARPWTPPLGEMQSRRFVRRSATLLGWISGIGLFFLLIRLLQINPISFGFPIWTLITMFALVAALIYVGVASNQDRETRRKNQAGHRAGQVSRRPVRRAR